MVAGVSFLAGWLAPGRGRRWFICGTDSVGHVHVRAANYRRLGWTVEDIFSRAGLLLRSQWWNFQWHGLMDCIAGLRISQSQLCEVRVDQGESFDDCCRRDNVSKLVGLFHPYMRLRCVCVNPADVPCTCAQVSLLRQQPNVPSGAMVTGSKIGALRKLNRNGFGASAPPVGTRFPDRRRWYNIVWFMWARQAGVRKKTSLKYIFRYDTITLETKGIIDRAADRWPILLSLDGNQIPSRGKSGFERCWGPHTGRGCGVLAADHRGLLLKDMESVNILSSSFHLSPVGVRIWLIVWLPFNRGWENLSRFCLQERDFLPDGEFVLVGLLRA